jgi:hypothetical protein
MPTSRGMDSSCPVQTNVSVRRDIIQNIIIYIVYRFINIIENFELKVDVQNWGLRFIEALTIDVLISSH